MGGMLGYGALAGAAGEYLKQSDEIRAEAKDVRASEAKNKYQELADKRLSKLRREEDVDRYGLISTENERKEGVVATAAEKTAKALKASGDAEITARQALEDSKLHTDSRGQITFDSKGLEISRGPDYTHASNVAGSMVYQKWLDETVQMRGNLKREKLSDLRDDWRAEAYETYDNPEFPGMGLKITRRNPDVKGFAGWLNEQVIPKDALKINDPKYMAGDPDSLLEYYREITPSAKFDKQLPDLIKKLKELSPWWQGPQKASIDHSKIEAAPGVPGADTQPDTSSSDPTKGLLGHTDSEEAAEEAAEEGLLQQGINSSIGRDETTRLEIESLEKELAGLSSSSEGQPRRGVILKSKIEKLQGAPTKASIKRKITFLEKELAGLEDKRGYAAATKKQSLENAIEKQQELLSGA